MKYLYAVAAAALALVAAFVFLQPVFSGIHSWGLYDWDQHMFYHESARISLLTFHQFPLWTPYYCGGNVVLANPQSPFLSPFFAFVMLFGTVVGLKLEALAYLAIGLLATFAVARKLGCRTLASVFAAVVFMFGSWYAARVAVGHTTFFPFALLPVVFLAYLHSSDSASALASRVRWAVLGSFTLAIMFLSGGIYPFYAAVILLSIYSLLDALEQRKISPVALVAGMLALALLLSSVKLLPVVDFASGIAPEKDVQLTSAGIVFKSLFSREQSIPENDLKTGRDLFEEGRQKDIDTLEGKLPWKWHEYSSYIGILPALLSLAAALLAFRRNWKLAIAALFFFLLALGNSLPLGPWNLIRQLPFFSSLHGPSRFMIVFAFFAALLAGRMLSSVRLQNRRTETAIAVILCVVVALDLFMVSRPLLENIFPLKPLEIKATNLGTPDFIQMYSTAPYLSQYPNLLQGIGTLDCYERLHLRIRAVPQLVDENLYPGFIANAYIAETNESLPFTSFTPNSVSISLSNIPKAEAAIKNGSSVTLVINQNFYKGWKFDGSTKDAGSYRGLLAALIQKEDLGNEVTFSYHSRPFALGAIVTLAAIALAMLLLLKPSVITPISGALKKLESQVFMQS